MKTLKVNMQVEREESPLCLEKKFPEFAWNLKAEERGIQQTACRLQINKFTGTLLWDSGRMETKTRSLIYSGPELLPETEYRAALTVWDNLGREVRTEMDFRTGLFAESFEDKRWCGAKWIGTGTRNLWAPALTVFRLSCNIALDVGSSTADLIFGAGDPRLMHRHRNIWGIESSESYISLQLDTSLLDEGRDACLSLFRVGYQKTDSPEIPLEIFPIPSTLLNLHNRYAFHTVSIECIFGEADVFLDGVKLNQAPEGAPFWMDGKINLNPAGKGGDFTAYPALCQIGCRLQPGQSAEFQKLTVRNVRQPENILTESFPDGAHFDGQESGFSYIFDPSHGGIPMVRSEFELEDISRAYLTITARGCYEAYLNGEKVGHEYLAPGLTQYNKTHMYQVYNVTDMLSDGRNAIAVELGEGWWSGSITFRGANWNFWGDVQSVILKFTAVHTDGSIFTLVSSPETFTASSEGPIRYGSLFQGQVYNAEKDVPGWKEPGFCGIWGPAKEIPLSPENAVLGRVPAMKDGFVDISYDNQKVLGQIGNGVSCSRVLTAKSVSEVRPGVFLYDLGQNFAGIPKIQFPACQGREITLRYGEICYPALPQYGDNQGMLMVENLRAAHATDVVILGKEPILFCPKFTFHGFRYIEISSLDKPLPVEDVQAMVLTSAEHLTAGFTCSDPRVSRLFENVTWSLRSNFLSIPTDCPQRNERMGWSGDLSVFAHTAVYLTDADAFLRRHLIAMRDLQEEDGMFPDIAPVANGFGGILWGSAGMTVPWEAYLQYGDKTILAEHYDAMARYISFLQTHMDQEAGLQTAGELGDWLGAQTAKTENTMLWTAYYIYDLGIMTEAASVLQKPEEAENYRKMYTETRRRFNLVYFDPETHRTVYSSQEAARGNRMPFQPEDCSKALPPKEPGGGYLMDTLTSYCVPLALGIVEEEHLSGVQENLIAFCLRKNTDDEGNSCPPYSLMTGFIGTALLLPALSQAGRDDTAYQVLLNDRYPSWLYPVAQGATTIWERLDSYTVENGFGGHNSMNSFNHYAFGAVGQWLLNRCLGIERMEPGFSAFRLCPTPDPTGNMTWAEGFCDTPAGHIESSWVRAGDSTIYTLTIPAGTSCLLELPASEDDTVTESGQQTVYAAGITGYEHGRRRYQLKSGHYEFTVTAAERKPNRRSD